MVIPSQALKEEGVETRREWPKFERIWLRYSPDNKHISGSENYGCKENR